MVCRVLLLFDPDVDLRGRNAELTQQAIHGEVGSFLSSRISFFFGRIHFPPHYHRYNVTSRDWR